MTHEPEISRPTDLCLPDGRLNPAAVGWSRAPVHRANLRGWGRAKRWEYWGIVTPGHVVGIVLSSLDYAAVNGVYVLERATGREWDEAAVVPLARGVVLPAVSGSGRAAARAGSVRIEIDQGAGGTTISASAGPVRVEVEVPLPTDHESMAVVVPWSPRRFQYTVKDVTRPVRGRLTLDGTAHDIPAAESFAVLDHGRGKWPYAVTWNWAAGSSPDRSVGIQLGGKWTDGTGSTENALVVDGRVHKLGADLEWTYDRGEWRRPWRIGGPRVDATLVPFHERVSRTNLLVLANETHQCFGRFDGWAETDDGRRVPLDGVVGWAEEARNRW
jgi:hypothetical protein